MFPLDCVYYKLLVTGHADDKERLAPAPFRMRGMDNDLAKAGWIRVASLSL
jgi:hypothetical protein